MANMNIEGTLGSMFKGMDGFISSKSSLCMSVTRSLFLL